VTTSTASHLGPHDESGRRRATIHDVARRAGVSRQTVSNVIRGRGRVGETTIARVREAVEALDYAPHSGAMSLRSQRTHQVAHPMPAIELAPGNAIAAEFVQALAVATGAHHYHLLLTASGNPLSEIEELIRSKRVDGFVFSTLDPHDGRIDLVADRGVPFACFGRTEPHRPQSWIDIDNAHGVAAVTRLLASKGHSHIAYLGFDGPYYWDRDREAGYLAAMRESALRPRAVRCGPSPADQTTAATALVEAGDVPSAVVTGSDALAAALYEAAAHRGMVVGADLDITGFDSSMIGRSLTPKLTTVAIPVADIAARIIGRLLREIDDGPTGEPGELVHLELERGDSA
jgi:DNA-binding LacI/PurR family transcriptional regulator